LPPSPSSTIARDSDEVIQLSTHTSTGRHQGPEFHYSGNKPHRHDVGDQSEGFFEVVPALVDSMTVASAIVSQSRDISSRTLLDEPTSYWRCYLISVLPTQTQCDM